MQEPTSRTAVRRLSKVATSATSSSQLAWVAWFTGSPGRKSSEKVK